MSAAHAGRLSLMGAGISAAIGGGLRALNPMQMARLVLPAEPDEEDSGPPPGADPGSDSGDNTPDTGVPGGPADAIAGSGGQR
ncbi:hypothetical protein CKO21_16530 [Rhodovibrio salinarum]|uniref:Uncharacterized protein n=1 Tax=Rhodovibrio salinarum TaxID=1087 RepID=A0A934QKZ4_9PROT|nr:hypothetical protein [Rhodovibrio salinarum]